MSTPSAFKSAVSAVALTLSSSAFAQSVVTDYFDGRLYPAHVTAVNFEPKYEGQVLSPQRLTAQEPITIDYWRVSLKAQMQVLFGEHVANSKRQKPVWGVIIHIGCLGPGETEQRHCVLVLNKGSRETQCLLIVHEVSGLHDDPHRVKITCPKSIELAAAPH